MNDLQLSIPLILLILGSQLISCQRPEALDPDYGINQTYEIDLLNKALLLNGKIVEDSFPESNGSVISVTNYYQAVEVNAGVNLLLPYNTNRDLEITTVYLKIKGANAYWKSPVERDSVSGTPFLNVAIPPFVQNNNFELVYAVGDEQGNISRVVNTNTLVSPQAQCGETIMGSVGITVKSMDLGDKAGRITISYDMYAIRDRLDLKYNNKWIYSTGNLLSNTSDSQAPNCGLGGRVSGRNSYTFEYDPSESRRLDIYVSGCEDGTAWELSVGCPM